MKVKVMTGRYIGALLIAQAAMLTVSAADFTYEKRYSLGGQVTGEIHPDPDGAGPLGFPAIRHTYDSNGNVKRIDHGQLTTKQPANIAPANWSGFSIHKSEHFTHDNWGRVLTEAVAAGSTYYALTQYSYDSLGRVHCKAVRMNPAAYSSLPASACDLGAEGDFGPDRVTRYTYDKRDNVLLEERAVGTALQQNYVEFTYNAYNKKTSVTDANGNYAKLDYDGHGRLAYWYFPNPNGSGYNSSDYEQYNYDDNGNRTYYRTRSGRVINYTYDNLNRMLTKDIPGSTAQDVYYGYDLSGLQLYARFGSHSGNGVTRVYDGFGNLKKETNTTSGTSLALSSEYDKHGNREKLTYPDGQYFSFSYDSLDRLSGISENGSTTVLSRLYSTDGTLGSVTNANNTAAGYIFDDVGRLSVLHHYISDTSTDLSLDFGYSPASQMTSQNYSNYRYYYDKANAPALESYDVNGLNQYVSVAGKVFSYDLQGNLTGDGVSTYVYDVENRLTSVSGSKSASFKYDPLGRLYQLVIGGTTTNFIYDGDAVVAEYSGSTLNKRYLYNRGGLTPVMTYAGSAVGASNRNYLHHNHQGSVIAETNSTGAPVYINTYDEYGIPGANNGGRFGYTGQMYLKELGLYHYKARIYSPKLGRFLQTDPVGYEDQINLYAYVGNDPMNAIDPTGKIGLLGAGIGAVIGGLSSIAVQSFTGDRKINWYTVGAATMTGAAVGATGGLAGAAAAKIGLTGAEAAATVLVPSAAVSAVGGGITQMVENTANGDPINQGVAKAATVSMVGTIAGGVIGEKAVNALTKSSVAGPAGSLAGGKVTAEITVTGTQELINQAASNTCLNDKC